jgi:hypothetical protein
VHLEALLASRFGSRLAFVGPEVVVPG